MKKLLLLIPLLAVALNSCTIDDGPYEWPKYDKLVKAITDGDWSMEYQYDNQKRLVKTMESYFGEVYTTIISYSNNKITAHYQGSPDYFQDYTYQYILDNNGYMIKVFFGGEGDGSRSFTYANGYLATGFGDENDMFPKLREFVWSNGNLIKEKYDNIVRQEYTYTNYPNDLNLDIGDLGFPLKFKGTYSKNLPATMTDGDEIAYYSYTFDTDGNLTAITRTKGEYVPSITYFTYY